MKKTCYQNSKPFVWLVTLFALVFLSTVCVKSSFAIEAGQNSCLYTDKSFSGEKICISQHSLSWVGHQLHHDISSVEIQQNLEMVAFQYPWYLGNSTTIKSTSAELGSWNNKIASFYLRDAAAPKDKVCFFSRSNYKGKRFCVGERDVYWLGWQWNNRISSVTVPAGFQVTLHNYWAFKGHKKILTSNTAYLGRFNNRASSIEIDKSMNSSDEDQDGVVDDLDQCSATPEGEVVDVNGCSPSQLDSDNDGINNSVDQCPDTPVGETVNNEGCAPSQLDSDNDGVNDNVDICPDTVIGDEVDADGCSASQRDLDSDGIGNAVDQCPNTEPEAEVNSQGCSFSQIDTDNDGVDDEADQCPNTNTEEPVDEFGCAQNQRLNSDIITIVSPQPADQVYADELLVTGTINSTQEIGVTVNGQVAMLDFSKMPIMFSVVVPIVEHGNNITVIATNIYRQTASKTAQINALSKQNFVASLSSNQGFLPFTAELEFTSETALRLISVEVDFDNDQNYEVTEQAGVGSYIDLSLSYEHIYETKGIHFINTRVQDENGQYYEQALVVNVLNKEQLKQQLTSKWNAMNSAIVHGDVKQALTQLSAEASPQFQPVFQALQSEFSTIVSEYSDMQCEDTALSFASCAVVRTNGEGKRTLHFINYVQDGQGLWKISGM